MTAPVTAKPVTEKKTFFSKKLSDKISDFIKGSDRHFTESRIPTLHTSSSESETKKIFFMFQNIQLAALFFWSKDVYELKILLKNTPGYHCKGKEKTDPNFQGYHYLLEFKRIKNSAAKVEITIDLNDPNYQKIDMIAKHFQQNLVEIHRSLV